MTEPSGSHTAGQPYPQQEEIMRPDQVEDIDEIAITRVPSTISSLLYAPVGYLFRTTTLEEDIDSSEESILIQKDGQVDETGGEEASTGTAPEGEKEEEVSLQTAPTEATEVTSEDDEEQEPLSQNHTFLFPVSKREIARGDHNVAIVWLMREMPEAKKLELRYFTGNPKEMSFEFTWQADDGVSRSIDMEVSRSQVIPLGMTLLTVIAESCKNLRELTICAGLERINELSLSKLLKAFSDAGHWEDTLERLEINWSCVEQGTFTGMQRLPQHLKSIKFDCCLMIDEIEVNEFVSR
eukprot:CAMPEP_0194071254 /NCGR_PEP_ID=MMETSP0009_2-20130614/88611_1 /TAXON_ID=210454 /ORGANISM="Grammatophora oceanica, Strain CCMP 410" /LENGTH=295 /DNA_ID=CAMNT_0038724569 /DNA_START=322 /DNA_END=1205 /DNA_ORIENTATION=-